MIIFNFQDCFEEQKLESSEGLFIQVSGPWQAGLENQDCQPECLHLASPRGCLHNSTVASGYMLAQDSKCMSSNEVETMACSLTLSFTDEKTDLGTLSKSTSGKETKWFFYIHRWMDKYIRKSDQAKLQTPRLKRRTQESMVMFRQGSSQEGRGAGSNQEARLEQF